MNNVYEGWFLKEQERRIISLSSYVGLKINNCFFLCR